MESPGSAVIFGFLKLEFSEKGFVVKNVDDIVTSIAEVCACLDSVAQDGKFVVNFSGFCLIGDSSNVHFLEISHDHYLPLRLVATHTSESGASTFVRSQSLWCGLDHCTKL